MLKKDLEKENKELKKQIEENKNFVSSICKKAIEENCDEALSYVSQICSKLQLDLNKDYVLSLKIDLPIHLIEKYNSDFICEDDIELTICGIKVNVDTMCDLEESY